MRTLVIILLLIFAGALQAQDTLRPYSFPRVGSHIDAGDVEYFQLFPDLTVNHHGQNESVQSDGLARVTVDLLSNDMVRFTCTPVASGRPLIKTVSSNAAMALGAYFEQFENIRATMVPFEFYNSDFLSDSLREAAGELVKAGILPKTWSEPFQSNARSTVKVKMHSGEQLQGYVLGLTDKHLLLWTAGPRFNPASVDTALHFLLVEDVDTLSVRGSERETSVASGLLGYFIILGQMAIGSAYNEDNSEAFLLAFACPIGAALGGLFPVSHEYILYRSSSDTEYFSRSPLSEARMVRPGLPPEVRKRLPVGNRERPYLLPYDRVPFVKLPQQSLPGEGTYWSVGIEQLWLSGDGLIGLKPGLTVGYDHAVLRAPTRMADIGFRAQLSGGSVYAAADLRATARFGPLQLFAGYRGMWLPEELSVSTTRPSTGISRNPTTTTTTQHAENVKQFLYLELGIELVLWRMVFSLHTLTQLSPSASKHSITTDYIHGGTTYEYRNDDMRLGGFIISMRYRF
jgi:hypothetical protein